MNKAIAILLTFLISTVVSAKEVLLSNSYFSHITVENGLSESNVKAILQDSYGFMWFGTKNGLNRYDGTSIVQKDCDDLKVGVGNHNIAALFEDSERQLWVGTDRGVYRYDPAFDVFTFIDLKTENGVSMNNWVSKITADSAGNIWVVIPDQGVFRYRNDKLFYYELIGEDNRKTDALDCICVRENGEVWVGSWGLGLYRYDENRDNFVHHLTDRNGRSLQGVNINDICDYGEWIAMAIYNGAVMKYNPSTNELRDIPLPAASETFVRNVMYYENALWIGTFDGLFIVDENRTQTVHLLPDLMRSFSLSDKFIYTIYRDRQNGIWLGTMFGGVNYLPDREMNFEKYVPGSDANSLNTKRVREINEDNSGNIWIGTEDGGINILNPATGKVKTLNYDFADKVNHQMILSVSVYGNKAYCGLFKQGMDVVDIRTHSISHYGYQSLGIGEGSVFAFFIDGKGNRWLGTGWGLYRASIGSFAFKNVESVGYDWIFDIFEDKNGNLWFATMGNGLWKHSPADDKFTKYEHIEEKSNSISSNSVSSIMQDSQGNIYLSTDRGGINRYNPETDDFTSFSVKDGLPDDVAYKILEDDNNNLWFGTNRGLVCFNPETKYVRVFTTKDGLPGNQFNYKSALKGKNGKFYFGGIEGLVAFDPHTDKSPKHIISLYITRFLINNSEVTVHTENSPLKQCITHTDKIILPYDRSNISFDLSLLSYQTTASNQYYYKMSPLDNEWVRAASNRNISFAKLPPGEYIFEVKATDGASDSFATRSLSIVILPPWWKSVWAYILYALACISTGLSWFFWYRRHKENQMEERQKLFEAEKEKELLESKIGFFTSIAHEIRTPLTLINAPLENINEIGVEEQRLKRNLNVIGQNTKRLLDLTAQLLDFQKIGMEKFNLRYERVDITSLLEETLDRFEPTMIQKKKEILKNIPETSIIAVIDKEAITKILSNLLNNALKYATKIILVELTCNQTYFTLRITSDGEKIPADLANQIFEPFYQIESKNKMRQGAGIGLSLARSLALLHKGSLYLDVEQADNCFVLTIPLNQEEMPIQTEKLTDPNPISLDEDSSPEAAVVNYAYSVLIVEDNEEMLAFIGERISNSFVIETAKNGQEALEILKNAHIDLVISDIMMPVMNGYELCKAMKSDLNLCHIPVIFLTAKNDIDSKIRGLKTGAEAYVEKPFSLNYLETQIVSILDNRRKEREAFSKRPFFPVGNMQMNKGDEEFANRIISEIQRNITDYNFGVERMAENLGMSRSNLLRKIKTLFNLSAVDFIRLIRLKKAAELIQEGRYTIGDVCFMVGINSSSYFGKLFLKQFGMTPKEFEKESRDKQRKEAAANSIRQSD
jgi:ligand-binding sensor domain-containing protein/signal transduction histidine kinase/DNA-binding response OmpR family regulator